MKNLLRLHEAVIVALYSFPDRKASFDEIALFIHKRNLFPNRKGNITLSEQIRLRTTVAKRYKHLFKQIDKANISLT